MVVPLVRESRMMWREVRADVMAEGVRDVGGWGRLERTWRVLLWARVEMEERREGGDWLVRLLLLFKRGRRWLRGICSGVWVIWGERRESRSWVSWIMELKKATAEVSLVPKMVLLERDIDDVGVKGLGISTLKTSLGLLTLG